MRPLAAGALVAAGTFALATARVFAPPTTAAAGPGDPYRGELVFERACASCHGRSGEGGVGPRLAGSGLTAAQVTLRVRQGGGVMPAGLVSGQEEADVVAYVVSLAAP
ncbi:MAG TPA: cytochrome c [Gaiellaceae bacterium]|nr:cytochrome c [Gaiellaceae bacterium]